MSAEAVTAERSASPAGWRTAAPALLVLALAAIMGLLLPAVDAATPYGDTMHRGDVVGVAAGVTLAPAPGWDLASGALVGRTRTPLDSTNSSELVDGSVDLYVQAAPFDGTPFSLLTRIDRIDAQLAHARGQISVTGNRYAVTTRQGVVGAGEDFVGPTRQGSIVAFVFEQPRSSSREGVEVVAAGPSGAISRRRGDIVSMIRSIRVAS